MLVPMTENDFVSEQPALFSLCFVYRFNFMSVIVLLQKKFSCGICCTGGHIPIFVVTRSGLGVQLVSTLCCRISGQAAVFVPLHLYVKICSWMHTDCKQKENQTKPNSWRWWKHPRMKWLLEKINLCKLIGNAQLKWINQLIFLLFIQLNGSHLLLLFPFFDQWIWINVNILKVKELSNGKTGLDASSVFKKLIQMRFIHLFHIQKKKKTNKHTFYIYI